MTNHTTVTEFVFLGLTSRKDLQTALFILFSVVYILTLTGNLLIIAAVRLDSNLHTPMYSYLANFAFLEIWYTTVTIPKMLADFLLQVKAISFAGCFLQFYFLFSLGATQCFFLTLMGFDRYLAICHPLRYPALINTVVSKRLAGLCWMAGFMYNLAPVSFISRLNFCGPNIINHYFCDPGPLLELACLRSYMADFILYAFTTAIIVSSLVFTLLTYMAIISAIVGISSSIGRQSAFSTCASHLMVVVLYYGSVMFVYVRPASRYPSDWNKMVPVLYSVVTPLLNPVIYSLRNRDVKKAMRKVIELCQK
ncbi:olfactory receptor 11H6-like [Pleurodeles waltl]|uniref:olfactory receptor 11H6-like n=1 Tax=Pleurodeles waltl TaxID=8319 RepID=UPI003709483C